MYPGKPVSSSLNTDIESSGISATLRVSRLIELWAKATKGTAKEARTRNANILFIIYFSSFLLINMLQAPPGTRTLKHARCSATIVPAEKLEPGWVFLSNFKTKHSRPREKGLERRLKQIPGGVKKDTCGVGQSIVQNLFFAPRS